jgi:Tfp pilus assembly protein PilZ
MHSSFGRVLGMIKGHLPRDNTVILTLKIADFSERLLIERRMRWCANKQNEIRDNRWVILTWRLEEAENCGAAKLTATKTLKTHAVLTIHFILTRLG